MAEKTEDEVLIEESSRGNEAFFESLVAQYSGDVGLLANRLLGWSSGASRGGVLGEVEDITQDVFLAAFVGLKKFRHDCDIKTWLFKITINKCRTFRYKQFLIRRRKSNKADPDFLPGADNKMLDDETFKKVRSAVKALPARYREVIVLRYLQELEFEEISKILGISVNTLHVRLNRAREKLKTELKEIVS